MLTGSVHEQPRDWSIWPESLQRALRMLESGEAQNRDFGVYELDGGLILQVLDVTTSPREELRPESHRRNIDVQFLAEGGPEEIGWYPDLGDNEPVEDLLDTPRDICFYQNRADAPEGRIPMRVGTYAMFFPWDIHIPAIQVGEAPARIKKIVIKVPLESCR